MTDKRSNGMSSIQKSVVVRRRQILEKRLEDLFQDLEAVTQQLGQVLSDVDRKHIDRQKEDINQRIDETATELDALEFQCQRISTEYTHFNRPRLDLESNLYKINFTKVEQTLRWILMDQRGEERAALLLFQRSTTMGGKWCAERVRELLLRETTDGLFRHVPIEFPVTEHVSRMAFLNRLGKYFKIEPDSQNLEDLLRCVIQKLCGSLQSGSIVMIECNGCDDLTLEAGIFQWLVEAFWRNMLREISEVSKNYYEIKVVVLLFFNEPLSERCLEANQCCTFEQFEKEKILEIPLCEWTPEDIGQWIAKYSGMGLPRSEVDRIANKVYRSAEGSPSQVANELLKAFYV
jgi:hypothetical protein